MVDRIWWDWLNSQFFVQELDQSHDRLHRPHVIVPVIYESHDLNRCELLAPYCICT